MARKTSPPHSHRSATGLFLAALIVGGWAAIHAYTLFFMPLTLFTAPLALLLIGLECWLFVGLFIVAHDAMHGSLAPGKPRLNAAIGGTLLFLYAGFSWQKLRQAHFDHHRAPGSLDDPDFDADHPDRFWRWYATFFFRYFGWRSIAFIGCVLAVYQLAFGVSVLRMVLFYAVPAIGSSLQLFYFGTFRPHRHEGAGSAEVRFADAHNARSERFGYLASLVSCFHFGYHHEHHLHPGTPWWGLPAVRARSESRKEARV